VRYLLDTNACIDVIRHAAKSRVYQKIWQADQIDVAICLHVYFELMAGVENSQLREDSLQKTLVVVNRLGLIPFSTDIAEMAAVLHSQLRVRGTPIGAVDLMIAASAIKTDRVLVTHNMREFSRVPGLVVEDWRAAP
jgi:tRNA(fMet)-specific endonuclease VapC